jgi:UDP-N-acetylglucosamine:LPS N-acetylglucosamine transferase
MTQRHLVVMAGGTGGHVFPGLAVAREVQRRGWSVSWLGTKSGIENRLVPPTGIALDAIGFAGLRGKGVLGAMTGGVRLLKAFWDCLRILRARGTSAVLGMGGYVCFPGGLMASLLGKPLVLVNADASLLLSTRSLLPVADAVAFGFDGPAADKTKHALVTGNVTLIYPHLMAETRTARIRIELPNPGNVLRPDMYADVEFATGTESPVLTVSSSAVQNDVDITGVTEQFGSAAIEVRSFTTSG